MSKLQALLHSYFFTPPLPAHHSELPIPSRKTPVGHSTFDVFSPLEQSLVNPKLLKSYSKMLCSKK